MSFADAVRFIRSLSVNELLLLERVLERRQKEREEERAQRERDRQSALVQLL
jgi:hypothetical protein